MNQSSLGETMGASAIIALVKVPAQYEKLIFTYMFLKEFHLLFSSLLLFCFGIKGQKGALLTIKFNLNRKEGRTGTWLT